MGTSKSTEQQLKVWRLYFFLLLVVSFSNVWGFNLDLEHLKKFISPESGPVFGHRVCHFASQPQESVLVTDPLIGNGTGGIYRCSYADSHCVRVPVEVESGTTFGLSLACGQHRAVVCGPRLEQNCEGFNYLNGMCAEFSSSLKYSHTLKPAFQECHVIPPLDAVILFDDSVSITSDNFREMIKFIKAIVGTFTDTRAQVAVAKYSTKASAVFHFENFAANQNPDILMRDVTHSQGDTYTPTAIRFVLENMFSEEVGMRNGSQKLLVVITDGKSNDKTESFDTVIPLAEKRGVIRFAIGVGNEYSLDELRQIASSPNFVFQTASFSTLASILTQLKEKIFSVEGTDVGNSSSIQLELSQGGFSVALREEVSVFGVVGAYSWAGGIEEKIPMLNASFINASHVEEDMKDSYLGYSVAVATVEAKVVYFAGAPRYKHMGAVLGFSRNESDNGWEVTHRANGPQLGSYFGAEMCVLNVGDGKMVLAVGAPMFHAAGVGGEVHVCSLLSGSLNCSTVLHGAAGNVLGRFGSSLAALQDLNGDGVMELAVGAPEEEQGRGAVYVFLGHRGGVKVKYEQRVAGTALGLLNFGLSLHSAGDLSSDGLPDVVVGSKGTAIVLRTHPVMCINVSLTLDPPIIPQDSFHCSVPHGVNTVLSKAKVCVKLQEISKGNIKGPLRAEMSMALQLDAGSVSPRLLFSPKSSSSVWNITLSSTTTCHTLSLISQSCLSDYHDVPLSGKLTIVGETVTNTRGLKPVLNPLCPHTFTHMVLLEKVCGDDHVCVADLSISLSIAREVVKSKDNPVMLSVKVLNNGEDATDTEISFFLPSALSFTHVKAVPANSYVGCVSNETSLGNITHTTCRLGFAIIRHKAQVELNLFFQVSDTSALSDRLTVNASVKSKHEKPETLHDNTASVTVPVKLVVSLGVKNNDSTHFIQYHQKTNLQHSYKVVNSGQLSLPVNVTFVIPTQMNLSFLWDVSTPTVNHTDVKCEKHTPMKKSDITAVTAPHDQSCRALSCKHFRCSIKLFERGQSITFTFIGDLTTQSQMNGVQQKVESSAALTFDRSLFSQFQSGDPLQLSIATVVELPPQSQTALIASLSVIFGLLLMTVIFFVLYKVGFFKSKSPTGEDGDGTASDCQTTESAVPDENGADGATPKNTANSQSAGGTEDPDSIKESIV